MSRGAGKAILAVVLLNLADGSILFALGIEDNGFCSFARYKIYGPCVCLCL